MKALITGASSGIGRDIAHVLGSMGCELILVARREERMEELKSKLPVQAQIICADLSSERECFSLYEQVRDEQIDILVNNAGFGVFGAFDKTDLTEELKLIDTNIRAVHILTKLFLKDFYARDSGYILNVSSASAFAPGPLMAAYYASKAYILHLTLAIWKELQHQHSRVSISALCPGPVDTEFNRKADVAFTPPSKPSSRIAEYAVRQMLAHKSGGQLSSTAQAAAETGCFQRRTHPYKLKKGALQNVKIDILQRAHPVYIWMRFTIEPSAHLF